MAVINETTTLLDWDRFIARFDPPRYVYGTVLDKDGLPAVRGIRVFTEYPEHRQIGSGRSKADGSYEIEIPFYTQPVRVVFDEEPGRNALIFKNVVPAVKP